MTCPDSVGICAVYHRRIHGRRGIYDGIFMTEEDYQKLRRWAGRDQQISSCKVRRLLRERAGGGFILFVARGIVRL